jgi:glutamyl-tRNA synthetase
MRLGWSPGHDDILSKEEAVAQFDIAQIGKAPSRLDFKKLDSVNAHFMALADDERLAALMFAHIAATRDWAVAPAGAARARAAIPLLKTRARNVADLADQALFLLRERPLKLDAVQQNTVKDDAKARLGRLRDRLAGFADWQAAALASEMKAFAADEGVGMGQIGPVLRLVLTGGAPAPDLGQVLEFLGRDEALGRISDQI